MIARLRRLLRAARTAPGAGALVRAVDRVWWTRLISRSGLVDAEFYAAQRGWRTASVRRAVADYVRRGYREGLSPNPLFDEDHVAQALPDTGRVPALYAYLVGDRPTVSVHPWWRPADDDGPTSLEDAWARRDEAVLVARVGDDAVPVPVRDWRRTALDAHRSDVAGAPVGAQATVVRMLQLGDRRGDRKIAPVLALPDGFAARLLCIGTTPGAWTTVALAAALSPRAVGARRLPAGTTFAEALRAGADGVGGGTLVVLDPRAVVPAADVRRLAETGAAALVTPVSLEADGTLAGVGAAVVTVAGTPRRVRPLRAHPVEDLPEGDARVPVPLLTGRTFAGPAALLHATDLGEGDAGYEAEVLTASARRNDPALPVVVDTGTVIGCFDDPTVFLGVSATLPAAVAAVPDGAEGVTVLYRAAGFALDGWAVRGGEAHSVVRWIPPHPGAQRWAIKTSAPAGPAGAVWGDAHFARGLASALRRRGHTVVVDAFRAADRVTASLDDVHVVIRGPFRIAPPRTGVRVEWIISHPDEITETEVRGFDLAFAVSPGWAARRSGDWGVPIAPLLECTDTDLFHPRGLPRTHEVVFVGTARGIARPSVVAPLAAGIDVKVYGPDWRGFIQGSAIAAPSIPNERLAERYETAAVVLNDHWPAMRREGFHAMRPYDVVAAGGRVISESVAGLADVFGAAVVEYDTADDLVRLLRGDLDALFPTDAELAEIGARIRAEHSFDARAAALEAAVRSFAGTAG